MYQKVYISLRFYPNITIVGHIKSMDKESLVVSVLEKYEDKLKRYYPKAVDLVMKTDGEKYITGPSAQLVSVEHNKTESELLLFLEWELFNDELKKRLEKVVKVYNL